MEKIKRYKSQLKEKTFVNMNNDFPIIFGKLNVGDKFHSIVSRGAGIHSDTYQWLEYEKISASQAKCTQQVGYGNTRSVGGIYRFAPNALVYNF
jgi:hypothetical protein